MAYTPLVNLMCPPPPPPPKILYNLCFLFLLGQAGYYSRPKRNWKQFLCTFFFGGGGGSHKMHHGLRLSHKATFRKLLRFFRVLRLFFPFFSTFFSFRKRSQLKSTGLNYCVSVWTLRLAQLPMPAWCCTPVHEVSGNT